MDDPVPEEPADGTLAWRYGIFRAVGFDIPTAISLAGNQEVDWHRMVDAVRGGCPLETALRIFT